MIKKGRFNKYAVIVQVSLLLLTTAALPLCTASGEHVPSLPLILEGDVIQGALAAPSGTEISVKLHDTVVGKTILKSGGTYGEGPDTKLVISCEPEDYGNLKFYVDGVASDVCADALKNLHPGDSIKLILEAEAPSQNGDGQTGSHSSGGPGSNGAVRISSSPALSATVDEEYSANSTGPATAAEETSENSTVHGNTDTEVNNPIKRNTEDAPAPESHAFPLMGIGLVVLSLVAIIAFMKYRAKE